MEDGCHYVGSIKSQDKTN